MRGWPFPHPRPRRPQHSQLCYGNWSGAEAAMVRCRALPPQLSLKTACKCEAKASYTAGVLIPKEQTPQLNLPALNAASGR
eukprot:355617-Chlamydomonas_euryale.AAC.17